MLTHYLISSLKNLCKYKASTIVGILSLAFSLVCFVPVVYWIYYETSFDSFYKDSSSIYRVYSIEKQTKKENKGASRVIEKKIREQVPGVEASTVNVISQENCCTDEVPYVKVNMLYTDSTFLNVFPQTFVCEETVNPLHTENNMIIKESMAIRLFGSAEEAVGKHLQTLMRKDFPPYVITAVVKDLPDNTNLSFDALVFHDMVKYFSSMPDEAQWSVFFMDLYVKLQPGMSAEAFNNRIKDIPTEVGVNKNIELCALQICDVRHKLNKDAPFTLDFIGLFVISSILLMFAAIFNFLNSYLDIFRQRYRELHLRAVNGATRKQLYMQMFVELGCSVVIAILIAILLLEPVQYIFGKLLGIEINIGLIYGIFAGTAVCVFVIMELLAFFGFWRLGKYAVSTYYQEQKNKPLLMRRLSVTLQMVISVLFIVVSWIVMEQLKFLGNKDLGINSDGLVRISGFVDVSGKAEEALMQELRATPGVVGFTDASFKPQHHIDPITTFSNIEWEGKPQGETTSFSLYATDENFSEIFGLDIKDGKWWKAGSNKCAVVNEEAVKAMGLEKPVGSFIRMPSAYDMSAMDEYEIIGVVGNFHALSFREQIMPMIFLPAPAFNNNLYFRVVPEKEKEVVAMLKSKLPEIDPLLSDANIEPVNKLYEDLNQSEIVGLRIFSFLALVCLMISLFGIFSVIETSTKRKRKEIAVRKVLGAKVYDIVRLFVKEYALIVVFASLVSFPAAYLIMDYWLGSYAYHIDIKIWWLIVIFIITSSVVLLTIWKQVFRAACENPAEVVKSE